MLTVPNPRSLNLAIYTAQCGREDGDTNRQQQRTGNPDLMRNMCRRRDGDGGPESHGQVEVDEELQLGRLLHSRCDGTGVSKTRRKRHC